jgi:hypothetical protein
MVLIALDLYVDLCECRQIQRSAGPGSQIYVEQVVLALSAEAV